MSCCNSIRRRLLVISAAIAYAAVTTASIQQQASAHAALYTTTSSSPPPSPHHSNNDSDNETILMVPTFSCGSQWQSATQCNQLCIDGNDSSCPTGQYCYAGIPCSKLNVEEAALRMEAELMAFSSSPQQQQQQQQQPIISFSSPTANVTPIIHENDNDEASLSYYSFNNIVDTMGSKLVEFAGSTFTFGMLRQ